MAFLRHSNLISAGKTTFSSKSLPVGKISGQGTQPFLHFSDHFWAKMGSGRGKKAPPGVQPKHRGSRYNGAFACAIGSFATHQRIFQLELVLFLLSRSVLRGVDAVFTNTN